MAVVAEGALNVPVAGKAGKAVKFVTIVRRRICCGGRF